MFALLQQKELQDGMPMGKPWNLFCLKVANARSRHPPVHLVHHAPQCPMFKQLKCSVEIRVEIRMFKSEQKSKPISVRTGRTINKFQVWDLFLNQYLENMTILTLENYFGCSNKKRQEFKMTYRGCNIWIQNQIDRPQNTLQNAIWIYKLLQQRD